MIRRGVVLFSAVIAIAVAQRVWAVCPAAPVNACAAADLAACCGATSCTIDGTVNVVPPTPGAVCDFDFGLKTLTILDSGHFRVGSNTADITAGSVVL